MKLLTTKKQRSIAENLAWLLLDMKIYLENGTPIDEHGIYDRFLSIAKDAGVHGDFSLKFREIRKEYKD